MVLRDVLQMLESWAPKELAWERDNVGLQIGSAQQRVRRVLVTVDVTDAIVDEAKRKKIDFIITHHPLIFHAVRAIDNEDRVGRLITKLLKSDISVYALHTNLDFTENGVSASLADRLGLDGVTVLQQHFRIHKKLVVYVPEEYCEPLIAAMSAQGAGVIGRYEYCSFRTRGNGTFRPGKGSKPFTGKVGRLETADEVRLEMIVPSWRLQQVLGAMRSAHPYDEVAYDVYDLANVSGVHGAGMIGQLRTPMSLKQFLSHVKQRLRIPAVRYAANPRRSIARVAVCGGSGSDLLPVAVAQGADAFVTADVTYHRFQESDGRIALVDAGHYETERPVLRSVVQYLKSQSAARKAPLQILESSVETNFVQYSLA